MDYDFQSSRFGAGSWIMLQLLVYDLPWRTMIERRGICAGSIEVGLKILLETRQQNVAPEFFLSPNSRKITSRGPVQMHGEAAGPLPPPATGCPRVTPTEPSTPISLCRHVHLIQC